MRPFGAVLAAACVAGAGGRRFFSPVWETARATPPEILPTFLGLDVLQDVPPEFTLFTAN